MNSKNDRLFGIHIYTDDKGRYVFYNIFNKTAYLLSAADDIKKYNIFQTRLGISILAGFVVLNFLNMPILGVGLGVAIYVVVTVIFYTKFIPNLAVAKRFDIRGQESFLMRYLGPMSNTRIMIIVILLVAISLLIIVNVRVSDFDELTVVLNYVVSGIAALVAVILLVAYVFKLRSEKGGKKRWKVSYYQSRGISQGHVRDN